MDLHSMTIEEFARWQKRTRKFIKEITPLGRGIVIRAMIRNSKYPEEKKFLKKLLEENNE